MMEIAHLLNLTVMVPYTGIQLFHETLVGVWLVIINRSEGGKCEEMGVERREVKGGKTGGGKKMEK